MDAINMTLPASAITQQTQGETVKEATYRQNQPRKHMQNKRSLGTCVYCAFSSSAATQRSNATRKHYQCHVLCIL